MTKSDHKTQKLGKGFAKVSKGKKSKGKKGKKDKYQTAFKKSKGAGFMGRKDTTTKKSKGGR